MAAPLPKMDTNWPVKSVKSTYGYTSNNGTPDKPDVNKMGDRFGGQGIDSGEQSESIDPNFCNQMYGNLLLTLGNSK